MINLKKKSKNKILTLILALFLFAIPFLPLFKNNVGTTLAYSPTKPTIDSSFYDYTSSDFISKYDGYITKYESVSSYGFNRFYVTFNDGVNIADGSNLLTNFSYYYIEYNGVVLSPNSIQFSSITYSKTPSFINFMFSDNTNAMYFFKHLIRDYLLVLYYNSNYYIIAGHNLYGKYSAYISGKNEVINNPNDNGLYTEDQYNNNYNNGFTAGKNEVINNPNDNGLYTEDQYNNNYNNGFTAGYGSSVNGILNGATFVPAIVYHNSDNSLNSKTGNYINTSNGHYTFTDTFFSDLKTIQSSYDLYQITIRIEELDFKFTDITLINVINNISVGSTLSFNVQYGTHDTGSSSIVWYDVLYSIVPVVDNGNIINYKLNYTVPDNLYNKRVLYINICFSENVNTIPYTYLNNLDIYDLNSSYSSGYQNGYDNGFTAGVDSVDTSVSYNNGYNDGYNVGKNDGISSANEYSFLGLIGAVVDAPIKAFTSLFDFEILGFNISTFILSLITICVIVTIVKLLLGGK